MVVFKNLNYESYLKFYQDKNIILLGAGLLLNDFLRNQRHKVELFSKVDYILDNDPEKTNRSYSVALKRISVMSVKEFLKQKIDLSNYIIIICIAKERVVLDILDELDRHYELNGTVCLYGMTVLSWGKEPYVLPRSSNTALPKPMKLYCIPKVIHYCWFGGNDMGEIAEECIASWKEHCPDFELRFWNESNYDIYKTPLYVQQAYESKKYAFVSDYVRLDIVYRYGGFYLDVDVLLLRSLYDFIKYKAVFGYLPWNEINTGLGFGSMAGNADLSAQMGLYEKVMFISDGEMNLTPCPEYSTDYFRRKGLYVDNSLKLVDDTLFLPSDYLCSLMPVLAENGLYYLSLYALTENSYALHKCASTWFEADSYNVFENSKRIRNQINARLLADWMKEEGVK